MPDTLDTPTDLPVDGKYFGTTGSNVIIALAIYGGVSVLDDANRIAKKFYTNWKANKAVKAQQTPAV